MSSSSQNSHNHNLSDHRRDDNGLSVNWANDRTILICSLKTNLLEHCCFITNSINVLNWMCKRIPETGIIHITLDKQNHPAVYWNIFIQFQHRFQLHHLYRPQLIESGRLVIIIEKPFQTYLRTFKWWVSVSRFTAIRDLVGYNRRLQGNATYSRWARTGSDQTD